MIKKLLTLIVVLLLAAGCVNRKQADRNDESATQVTVNANQQAFFNNLALLCGKSFAGREVYMIPENESWSHLNFVIHVNMCDNNNIQIPFHLSEDRSRTWMFILEDGRLRFRHDHRKEDGTPDEITLYGGYASRRGTPFVQYFPADDYTCELIPYACTNEWIVEIAEDFSSLTYKLTRNGILRFEAIFDLTKPVINK